MQHKQSSRRRFGSAAFLAVLMATAAPEAIAQVERNIPTEPYAVDEAYLSGLNWRNIGPNRGGRSTATARTCSLRGPSRTTAWSPAGCWSAASGSCS